MAVLGSELEAIEEPWTPERARAVEIRSNPLVAFLPLQDGSIAPELVELHKAAAALAASRSSPLAHTGYGRTP